MPLAKTPQPQPREVSPKLLKIINEEIEKIKNLFNLKMNETLKNKKFFREKKNMYLFIQHFSLSLKDIVRYSIDNYFNEYTSEQKTNAKKIIEKEIYDYIYHYITM